TAQDIHFSQFYNAPFTINPALTGLFKGDQRLTTHYRNQWASVPVPYLTFSGAWDQKLPLQLSEATTLGGGLRFNFDRAGDGEYQIAQLGLLTSVTQQLADHFYAGVGAQLTFGQRRFAPEKLTFAEQWNGDVFDPNRPVTENFDQTAFGMVSISAGLNLNFSVPGTRTRINGGIAFYHLNQPAESFFSNPRVVLPRRNTQYLSGNFQTGPKTDLRVVALWSFMDGQFSNASFREVVGGVGFRYHLNLTEGAEINALAGLNFRVGDAVIPTVEMQYQSWHVGLSYDVNISAFEVATGGQGGPEVFVSYIITQVKPPEVFKACPVF
ncbi:MAG: type IX secretion system membrane protein PorP/SprF, partial [Bacteroidetes bacterium]